MKPVEAIKNIHDEFKEGISKEKCKKCGCMKEALICILNGLSSIHDEGKDALVSDMNQWMKLLKPTEYACNSCSHCYPAFIINTFNDAFPHVKLSSSSCMFEVRELTWPAVPGDYYVLENYKTAPVAVTTLSSDELAEKVARLKPEGLCIIGKTETENIGIDKVIKNTITNPAIKHLIITGKEPKGHLTGNTFISLFKNGVDENMRIKGARGKRPVLNNVSEDELETFLNQVEMTDMIGCEDEEKIADKIKELSVKVCDKTCTCSTKQIAVEPYKVSTVKVVKAKVSETVLLDKAGYFVILPDHNKKTIIVEHYSYENKLLHAVEGKDARSIYNTIINNRWVTQLDHAAYLGKELAKAELSLENIIKYVQDGA